VKVSAMYYIGSIAATVAESSRHCHHRDLDKTNESGPYSQLENGAASAEKVSVSYDDGATFLSPSFFSFTDGEAVLPIKACDVGRSGYCGGCSVYVIENMGPVDCPASSLLSASPTENPTAEYPSVPDHHAFILTRI
jgi:hypothetical protein